MLGKLSFILVIWAGCSERSQSPVDSAPVDSVGRACHSSADCDDQLYCWGPNQIGVCGIPPRQECASDAACGGTACQAVYDTCSRDGVGSECRTGCSGDDQCGDGFRCELSACVAIRCDQGYQCFTHQVCDVSRIPSGAPIYDRHHGCFDVECTADDDCGGGFCVNLVCQDALGACQPPVAVR